MLRDNITLTISTRPLRLVFVIHSREDIARATHLFTHVWGGSSNIIIPSPQTDDDVTLFNQAIQRFDPDIVFFSAKEMTKREVNALQYIACEKVSITDETISQHSLGEEFLRVGNGVLSHSGLVLDAQYPSGLPKSNIHLLDSDESDLNLRILYGTPTHLFRQYLSNRLNSRVLRKPKDVLETCKLSVLAAHFETPISLSLSGLTRNYSLIDVSPLGGALAVEYKTLYIFPNDDSISVACAFWNLRGLTSSENKILLSMNDFLSNNMDLFALLLQVYNFDQVIIVAKVNEVGAQNLYDLAISSLDTHVAKAKVQIIYDGFDYSLPSTHLSFGFPETSTRVIGDDDSVRFIPRPPVGHDKKDKLFGFDCKLRSSHGQTLSLPSSQQMAVFLRNELQRLQNAKTNKDNMGTFWLRSKPAVRPHFEGIAGSTTPGQECLIFLHEDEAWITGLFDTANIRIEPNRHTQYARGFIKKFGGISKTLALIRFGGQRIIQALSMQQAAQCGMVAAHIVSTLKDKLGIDQKKAQEIVGRSLPELLSAGLVKRGVALTCPICNLRAWYSINNLDEFIECMGCAEHFQLNNKKLDYSYVANELAERFVTAGGEALLVTAATLLLIQPSALIQFGGDLYKGNEKSNFAEIDLVVLSREAFILVECKSFGTIDNKALTEIHESTSRAIEAASIVGATDVVVGVVAKGNIEEIHPAIVKLVMEGKTKGIDVNLILNGDFFLHGASEPTDISKISFYKRSNLTTPKYVGEVKTSYGIGGRMGATNTEILKKWAEEMSVVSSATGNTSS